MASLCWESGDGRLTARRAVRRGSQAVPACAMDPPATFPPGQGQMSGERRRPRALRSRPRLAGTAGTPSLPNDGR
jgi:hypothetical protein